MAAVQQWWLLHTICYGRSGCTACNVVLQTSQTVVASCCAACPRESFEQAVGAATVQQHTLVDSSAVQPIFGILRCILVLQVTVSL